MFFKSKEKIIVGSSAYNLAGDVINRGNFLKNNVLHTVMSGASKYGIGKGIVDAHIKGPATSYKSFYRWAESSGYNTQVGNLGGLIYSAEPLSVAGFQYLVPVQAALDQRAITNTVSSLDLHLIALEWIINNTPADRNKEFTVSQEQLFGVLTGNIRITYTLGGTAVFTPAYNLDSNMSFMYLYYEERVKDTPVVTDTGWITDTPPVKVGFTGSPVTDPQIIVQDETTTTLTEYSDGTPSTTVVTTVPLNLAFDKITGTYTKITTIVATPLIVGKVTTLVQYEESFYNVVYTDVVTVTVAVIAGVTVTTTVTVSTPSLEVYWKYRQVTTELSQTKWSPFKLKIYQKGTDITGDGLLFSVSNDLQKFYPIIPLRRENTMVDLGNFPTQYGWNRNAVRRCFGTKRKYNDLIDSLTDNPDISDIDHAWTVFGVSLGTQQQDGKKYLYEFFKNLSDTTIGMGGAIKSPSTLETQWAAYVAALKESTNDEISGIGRPTPPVIQDYTMFTNSFGTVQDWLYNVTITAKGGGQVLGTGYHANALGKVGKTWAYIKYTITLEIVTADLSTGNYTYTPTNFAVIAFGKQLTSNSWEEYEFFDLVHVNNVYGGLTVTTLGDAAIVSMDENSSFIVPLLDDAFDELTLVRRTQLSLECAFLVVNYYDKVKIPWYASSFFKIVVVAIIITVAVYTGYVNAESSGVLGTNSAVGTALGFTGTTAITVGAIANAAAAAVISGLLTKVSTAIFGEEFGKLIGLIASAITINALSTPDSFNLANSWTELTKADNLIKLSFSGVEQYGSYLQGQASEINTKTQAVLLESNEALREITRMTQELLGNTGIDPSTITNALRYATENPAQFLSRTTMTGTEIAELSMKIIEDFPNLQLTLPSLD
jgi:hypothetical protein